MCKSRKCSKEAIPMSASSIADLPAQAESQMRLTPPYQTGSRSFRSVSEVQGYAGIACGGGWWFNG